MAKKENKFIIESPWKKIIIVGIVIIAFVIATEIISRYFLYAIIALVMILVIILILIFFKRKNKPETANNKNENFLNKWFNVRKIKSFRCKALQSCAEKIWSKIMELTDKISKKKSKIKTKAKKNKKANNLDAKQKFQSKDIDMDNLAEKMQQKTPSQHKFVAKQIKEQREPIKKIIDGTEHKELVSKVWVKTGIPGFDELFEKGIPKGTSILIAGGAGSGKTIMCLQMLNNAALNNEKGLYISLEESEIRLKKHMHDFGWKPEELEKKGLLKIQRVKPFTIARQVEALLAKEKGELKMKIGFVGELIPKNFKPQWVIIDSLTALAAAFKDDEITYRVYVESLFHYLEGLDATSFLISETEQIPVSFSKTGVEEFLADGVIVLYNIKHENVRENAIEVLKLRGAKHEKKIVALQILSDKGIVVYPDQEVFSNFGVGK